MMEIFPHKSCYLVLACIVTFNLWTLALTNVGIDSAQLINYLLVLLPFACFPVAVSKVKFTSKSIERVCRRASYFSQGFLFLQIAWVSVRIFNHLSMRLSSGIDYADGFLSDLDRLILTDWVSYFDTIQSSPISIRILDQSYGSLTYLSGIVYLIVSCFRDIRRSAFFLESFFFSAVICTLIGMFFPAQGSIVTHLGAIHDFSNFSSPPGMWFIDSLEAVRSGRSMLLDLNNMPGLVSFPSFHTTSAVILTITFWRTVLFVPMLFYGTVVVAATPIFGGHYFVDLLGGAAIAIFVTCALALKQRFRDLFVPRNAMLPSGTVADQGW
jgi:membrane-associated phospholipid phosphatase